MHSARVFLGSFMTEPVQNRRRPAQSVPLSRDDLLQRSELILGTNQHQVVESMGTYSKNDRSCQSLHPTRLAKKKTRPRLASDRPDRKKRPPYEKHLKCLQSDTSSPTLFKKTVLHDRCSPRLEVSCRESVRTRTMRLLDTMTRPAQSPT